MLIIITLGFTETFALRSVFKKGLKPMDKIIIIQPNKEDERAIKAKNTLIDIVTKVVPNIEIINEKVDTSDFFDSIKKITSVLNNNKERPIYANLSGGMRLLIVEVLMALTLYPEEAEVEIYSEDGSNTVTFKTDFIKPVQIDQIDRRILSNIENSKGSITSLSNLSNLPKSTVWRRLKKLEELNLVKNGNLTPKGYLIISSSKSGNGN
ncbi:MAG: hypothetical protein C0171_02095 [Caldisphaera sp.]|jgi:CRISPR-associated protein Csa3|nr:MAG: hypothetical protein C0171_02095 [Caldisphaera sp.]